MARIKFDPKVASQRLKKEIEKVSNDKKLEFEYGKFLTERVRFQARKGKPLNKNKKFPPLSEASKNIRKGLGKKNKTHPAFRSDKSNLTFSGQLQDAIAFRRFKNGKFELFVKPTRRRRIEGSPNTLRLNNEDIDRELRRGVDSRQLGRRKFVLFDTVGLKSDKKIPKRLKQILLRFLRRQLR